MFSLKPTRMSEEEGLCVECFEKEKSLLKVEKSNGKCLHVVSKKELFKYIEKILRKIRHYPKTKIKIESKHHEAVVFILENYVKYQKEVGRSGVGWCSKMRRIAESSKKFFDTVYKHLLVNSYEQAKHAPVEHKYLETLTNLEMFVHTQTVVYSFFHVGYWLHSQSQDPIESERAMLQSLEAVENEYFRNPDYGKLDMIEQEGKDYFLYNLVRDFFKVVKLLMKNIGMAGISMETAQVVKTIILERVTLYFLESNKPKKFLMYSQKFIKMHKDVSLNKAKIKLFPRQVQLLAAVLNRLVTHLLNDVIPTKDKLRHATSLAIKSYQLVNLFSDSDYKRQTFFILVDCVFLMGKREEAIKMLNVAQIDHVKKEHAGNSPNVACGKCIHFSQSLARYCLICDNPKKGIKTILKYQKQLEEIEIFAEDKYKSYEILSMLYFANNDMDNYKKYSKNLGKFEKVIEKKEERILKHTKRMIKSLQFKYTNRRAFFEIKELDMKSLSFFFGLSYSESIKKIEKLLQIRNPLTKKCNQCRKELVKPSCCSRCKSVFYCNRDCQMKDWENHKHNCNK